MQFQSNYYQHFHSIEISVQIFNEWKIKFDNFAVSLNSVIPQSLCRDVFFFLDDNIDIKKYVFYLIKISFQMEEIFWSVIIVKKHHEVSHVF